MEFGMFATFPVAGTNIFPLSNSKQGGQLLTEFNLISRDSVNTPTSVPYMVGPSFVHSPSDYNVQVQQDATGQIISPGTLEILPGRGVINGHYVETLYPMTVDLVEHNKDAYAQKSAILQGELAIGIKIIYSTELTMSGSMLVEDPKTKMYQGVQLVVMPADQMKTPFDADPPKTIDKVTAHLRLATFSFYDGTIQSIKNSTTKCQCIGADRIAEVSKMLGDEYLRKSKLNQNKLYVFSGKGVDPNTGEDTWCDATDSLMVWDGGKPPVRTKLKPTDISANFARSSTDGKIQLRIPHKQVDGMDEYYQTVVLNLPVADFGSNLSGTVDKNYTKNIKSISDKLSQFYQLAKGKQVAFLDSKDEDTKLPLINPNWKIGDYVLVKYDFTADVSSDGVTPPATMYAVIPGYVTEIAYQPSPVVITTTKIEVRDKDRKLKSTETSVEARRGQNKVPPDYFPSDITGVQLVELNWSSTNVSNPPDAGTGKVIVDGEEQFPTFFTDEDDVRGSKAPDLIDYFLLKYEDSNVTEIVDDTTGDITITTITTLVKYFYTVTKSTSREWSNYVPLTGEIPFAQEDMIGGFLNVSDTDLDGGYVYRDDDGYLRLLDYSLLRSGALAYQLGEDLTLPQGIDTDEVQANLDEYVNQRVAFPNANQVVNADKPNVINLYIDLSAEEGEAKEITIRDIDSRFNTCVYLHFSGSATSNTTINIVNCQKVRIESNLVSGGPKINIYRSCLYYDASVMNYIRKSHVNDSFTGMQDIRLWYERFEDNDANLVVDNMTVSELDAPIISNEVDFWNKTAPDDNHYYYGLKSITFSGSGDIVGCSILVANDSTHNILSPGHKIIVGDFSLPQGYSLVYPISCLTRELRVTGTFVSAYKDNGSGDWLVTDTNFTAVTGKYSPVEPSDEVSGSIAFHADTNVIDAQVGDTIPGWETDSYHIFSGGVVK